MLRAKVQWSKQQIEKQKAIIKTELGIILKTDGPKKRLHHILGQIRETKDASSPSEQLRCYIFIVSALIHHERYGGLSLSQVQKLAAVAHAILQVQGVQPIKSLLAYLYGEVHLAVSQVYRKEGVHWMAAWEQQMAAYLSGTPSEEEKAFQLLSTGIRALRLGLGPLAAGSLAVAKEKLSDRARVRGAIDYVRSLRFGGDRVGAEKVASECLKWTFLSPEERQELQWEILCGKLPSSGDIGPIIASVSRKGLHHQYVYVIEAFLWSRAVPTNQWIGRYPSVKSLAKDRNMIPPSRSLFYKCAVRLQKCYDYQVPFPVRLRQLGKMLPKIRQLVTIDQELLVWAATARWLTRSRCFALATLALNQYRNLSFGLSGGANSDALGVVSDLLERDWFKENDAQFAQRNFSISDWEKVA